MSDGDMLYKCLECDTQEIVKAEDNRKDGRVCKKCKGHLASIAFIAVDWANDEDVTSISTPGSKNRKISEVRKNGT